MNKKYKKNFIIYFRSFAGVKNHDPNTGMIEESGLTLGEKIYDDEQKLCCVLFGEFIPESCG